jgi:putative addiction module killer protein/probable addiction module antidote protein
VIELVYYKDENGRSPFIEWIAALRDKMAKTRIAARLRQIESGNFGDSKPVGEGVTELRIHIGAGYRVYCGRHGPHWVVLLCGGDKDTQPKDIARERAMGRVEAEAAMKELVGVGSYNDWEVQELRKDREFALAYLQVAMESLNNPEERAGGLLALRAVAEAYGGLGVVAAQAGISRESLYRALSPKGNPTLRTLIAVLKTLGLRLSVADKQQAESTQAKQSGDSVAA